MPLGGKHRFADKPLLVIGADALCLYLNVDRVWDVNVPALEIARSIHPAFAFIYTLIIFALIYNTVFSLFYSTARRFSGGQTIRMRIVLVGVVAVGYAASLMGFKKLIGGMYPIIGWLGVALLVVLAVGWLRERSAVLREENLRRKLIRVLVRKHADDLEYTDEHREKVRELSRASVADSKQLRRDAPAVCSVALGLLCNQCRASLGPGAVERPVRGHYGSRPAHRLERGDLCARGGGRDL